MDVRPQLKLQLKLLSGVTNFVRFVTLVFFFQAMVSGSLFGVTFAFMVFAFDLWTTVHRKINAEAHEQFMAEHERRMKLLLDSLTPEEREEYERVRAAFFAQHDEQQVRWWRRFG